MKGNLKTKAVLCLLTVMGLFAGTASAQTYSGYLKADEGGLDGIDSLHFSITLHQDNHQETSVKHADGRYSGKGYYATPWLASVKTNLLADVISVPYAGFEVQLMDNVSLDLGGWYGQWNLLYPNNRQTRLYGAAPELRWWVGGDMMRKGHFVGLHGMAAWYTLAMENKDGNKVIYQNGTADLDDTGSMSPSWNCGLTYGYSLPLDRQGRFCLEFYAGLGYMKYQHKRIVSLPDGHKDYEHQVVEGVSLTKAGINLAYRFSLRRYREK